MKILDFQQDEPEFWQDDVDLVSGSVLTRQQQIAIKGILMTLPKESDFSSFGEFPESLHQYANLLEHISDMIRQQTITEGFTQRHLRTFSTVMENQRDKIEEAELTLTNT